jgi:hypothetical protein
VDERFKLTLAPKGDWEAKEDRAARGPPAKTAFPGVVRVAQKNEPHAAHGILVGFQVTGFQNCQ